MVPGVLHVESKRKTSLIYYDSMPHEYKALKPNGNERGERVYERTKLTYEVSDMPASSSKKP
jgi:hypothetical protein